MAADIKKLVSQICNLTVIELCKLVEALKNKFGLGTSDTIRPDINGEEKKIKPNEDLPTPNSEKAKKLKPAPDPSSIESCDKLDNEPEDKEAKPVPSVPTKRESKPVPDPPSVEVSNSPNEPEYKPIDEEEAETDQKVPPAVPKKTTEAESGFNPNLTDYDSNRVSTKQKSNNRSNSSPPKPKGENYDLVYAWRYSDNKRYAKIGRSTTHLLPTRMPVTYYPTGDPVLIGIRKCEDLQHAEDLQNHILKGLKRPRRDREWVEIDEMFKKMIDKSFISDPDELKKIFGENIKTE